MKFLFLCISALFLLSCSPSKQDEHAYQHHESHHSFHNVEKYAAIFESADRKKWQQPDKVISMAAVKNGDRVADIGAGTGYFTRRFAQAVSPQGIAIGYDIEPAMVAYMQKDAKKLKLSNYKAEKIDPSKPELKKNFFDLIFLSNTYHHIPQQREYFRRLKQFLKPSGRIIIVDFAKKDAPVGPPTQMKIDKSTVISDLKAAGYKPSSEKKFLPYQYFLEFHR